MEAKMKDFGDNVFLKFGDPFSRNEHAKRLLKELEEIKATEDNYYIELKKTQKEKAETPSFMQIINMHTEGLTKNLRAFQEVYEDYDKSELIVRFQLRTVSFKMVASIRLRRHRNLISIAFYLTILTKTRLI